MRSKLTLLIIAAAVGGCQHKGYDLPDRGVTAVNAPVITRANYAIDLAAPGGALDPTEAARLGDWFEGLGLRYGDTVYVDAPYGQMARADVERIAGQYGLMVAQGSPVTTGQVSPENVRVVVSRAEASVPNCPNWTRASAPNYNNQMMPNFGCGVNSNLAAMIANPEDLVHGRAGSGVADAVTSGKAVETYRAAPPTGREGLQEISTTQGGQ